MPQTGSDVDDQFVPSSLNAAIGDDFTTEQPVRISFQPYGRATHGDEDQYNPEYRCLDGYLKGKEGYTHLRTVGGEWFILTDGSEFAPSREEWLGEDVVEQFDESELDELPTPPLEDESLVIGKRAVDGNGYVPIGVNPVILLPTDGNGDPIKARNVSQKINRVQETLGDFHQKSPDEAREAIKAAISDLKKAKRALDGEYKNTPRSKHHRNQK